MAGTTPKKTIYPFAEMFEITCSKVQDEAVDIWEIPAGTMITLVLAKIKTAGVGASNLIIGDDDDDNGYILAGDCVVAVDTVYGDVAEERGVYLTGTTIATCQGTHKLYKSAGKTLKIEQSGTQTTAAVVDVFVFGYRYHED